MENFIRSQKVNKNDVFEKEIEKGKFYFIKTKSKEILTKDLLTKIIPKSLNAINWKKSMKWSDNNLMWGRPLRSILAIFNKKTLKFNYHHLKSTNSVIIETDLITKTKSIKTFKEYNSF